VAHYYICEFGLNRLRIDGDIRQKNHHNGLDNCDFVVIPIYRLSQIQLVKHYCKYDMRKYFLLRDKIINLTCRTVYHHMLLKC